jgi:hypothetical protein
MMGRPGNAFNAQKDYDALGFFGTALPEKDWHFPFKPSTNAADIGGGALPTKQSPTHRGEPSGPSYTSQLVK